MKLNSFFCFKITIDLLQETDLINYLKEELDSKDKELFLVVDRDVEKEQSWLLEQNSYTKTVQERDAEVLQLKDIVNEDFNVIYNPLCNNTSN